MKTKEEKEHERQVLILRRNNNERKTGAKTGKILKKEDVEIKKGIDIENYLWVNLNINDLVLPDNERKNIILKDYHLKQELEEKISTPAQFMTPLALKSKSIIPIDLTLEYAKSQEELILKKKRKMLDEDEAVAFELAEIIEKETSYDGSWKNRIENIEKNKQTDTNIKENIHQENIQDKITTQTKINNLKTEEPIFTNNKISMTEIEALKDQAWKESYEAGYNIGNDTGIKEGFEKGFLEGKNKSLNNTYEEIAHKYEQEYIKKQSILEQEFMQKQELLHTEFIDKETKYQNILHETIFHLNQIQSEIMTTGQELFLEITKLASESILRTELQKDDVFMNFFHNAVKDYLEMPFLTIELNTLDAKRLTSLLNDENIIKSKIKIKENNNMLSGDMKIDSGSEISLIDIKKSVTLLVENLSKDIISQEKLLEAS